jgi:hypothetical protein
LFSARLLKEPLIQKALFFVRLLNKPHQPEVDDADQELESGAATICDPLRRSLTVRGARRL